VSIFECCKDARCTTMQQAVALQAVSMDGMFNCCYAAWVVQLVTCAVVWG
jgi:hypothetical protein